jgi:hypothetical protein
MKETSTLLFGALSLLTPALTLAQDCSPCGAFVGYSCWGPCLPSECPDYDWVYYCSGSYYVCGQGSCCTCT